MNKGTETPESTKAKDLKERETGPESKENTGVQNQTKALLKLSVETAPPLEGCLSQGLSLHLQTY